MHIQTNYIYIYIYHLRCGGRRRGLDLLQGGAGVVPVGLRDRPARCYIYIYIYIYIMITIIIVININK